MISHYKDLLFWQTSYDTAKAVMRLCKKLPKEKLSDILIAQIIRSSASIGANIAEGFGRYKTKEYERFLQIALGSANETDYWLLLLKDAYPLLESEVNIIIMKNIETIKMLAASLKSLRIKRSKEYINK